MNSDNNIETLDVSSDISNDTNDVQAAPIDLGNMSGDVNSVDLNVGSSDYNNELNSFNNVSNSLDVNDAKNNGFDNIGTDTPYKEEKKPKNKKLLFIIALILVLVIGVGIFLYLRLGNKSVVSGVVLKDLEIQSGSALSKNVSDYVKSGNAKGCVVKTDDILNNKIGSYEYSVVCGNKTYKGKINIVDTKAPVIKAKNVIVKVNSSVTAESFVDECVEGSKCNYAIQDQDQFNLNLSIPGMYEVNIDVTDDYDNKTTFASYLVVLASDLTHNLECKKSVDSEEYSYQIEENLGFIQGNAINFVGISDRKVVIKYKSDEAYNKAKESIDSSGKINLDIAYGLAKENDENKEIVISNILSTSDIQILYGDYTNDYSGIRNLYDSQGFSCEMKKIEH